MLCGKHEKKSSLKQNHQKQPTWLGKRKKKATSHCTPKPRWGKDILSGTIVKQSKIQTDTEDSGCSLEL